MKTENVNGKNFPIFHSVFSVFSDNDRAKANHQEEEGKTDWKITPTKTTEYNNNNQQPTKILYVLYFNVECIGGEWEGYGGEGWVGVWGKI